MGAISTFPATIKDRRAYSRPDPWLWHVQLVFDDALGHHLAGRIDEAMARYRRALSLKPDYADAHNNLGAALAAQGKIDDAIARYKRALSLKPDCADAHFNMGAALVEQGKIAEGIAHYNSGILLNPDNAGAHFNLGFVLASVGRSREAMAHYRRVIAINPNHSDAHNNLGNLYLEQGKFAEALAHYGRSILLAPDNAEAQYHRAEIKTFSAGDPDLAALESLAARPNLPASKAPFVHFALGKALEDTGDYTRAVEHLRKGNALRRSQLHYDEPAIANLFRRIAEVFDSRLFERFQGAGDPSSIPIFVLGMPRSGSTLVEQILAAHPRIQTAGELMNLEFAAASVWNSGPWPECVAALDEYSPGRIAHAYLARLPALAGESFRIVDKLPANFLNIGLIRLILPNARIIHTVRDPLDTCVSCYSKLFTTGQHFSYDLGELGRYYRRYTDLMDHWRAVLPPGVMLEVAYEDVVQDLERQARRLIDYCGLPWDDRCLSFYKNDRPVKTASAVQVRQPLFRSSLKRWRKYEAGLGPLLQELGDIVPPFAKTGS